MSTTTHTPGPWRCDAARSRVTLPSGAALAFVNIMVADGSQQHDANVYLIAGAPELLRCAVMALEELQEAARVNPLAPIAFRALQAAITAATSASDTTTEHPGA
ncbi:hypothetical protein [uncultured Sphaerotilus sp.]|uniref:hypothetical protein n=1 Tax=uncultured Sphaerotilus sp. TaxID=474984 RepID=UPI0030CA176D